MADRARLDVTIAICTRDRAALLARAIASVLAMRTPPGLAWELVVVNNGSTDHTSRVVEEFGARGPVREAVELEPGIAAARNRALDECRGNWLLFLDDDIIADENLLVAFREAIAANPGADVIAGYVEPEFEDVPHPMLVRAFPELERGYCGLDHGPVQRPLGADEDAVTANLAVNAGRIGGLRFDTTLGHRPTCLAGGEDTFFLDQVRRNGGIVFWQPGMRVKHFVPVQRMTLAYLTDFVIGEGRKHYRLTRAGRRQTVLRAPWWLFRANLETYIGYVSWKLRGDDLAALKSLRRHLLYRGMLLEALNGSGTAALHAAPTQPGPAGVSPAPTGGSGRGA